MAPQIYFELKNAVVGIAGLGGLGSNVGVALTRLRVGKLILVDFDVVEESNLTRQNYFADQIGRHKVDASIENFRRINPDANLEGRKMRLEPVWPGMVAVMKLSPAAFRTGWCWWAILFPARVRVFLWQRRVSGLQRIIRPTRLRKSY